MISNQRYHRSTSRPQQYYEYSLAYIDAAIDICMRMMATAEEEHWPNMSAAMFNSAHGVELFLKGILLRAGEQIGNAHDITFLLLRCKRLKLVPRSLLPPMTTKLRPGQTYRTVKLMIEDDKTANFPSIETRYPFPTSKELNWSLISSASAQGLLSNIRSARKSFVRIWARQAFKPHH